MLQAPRLVGVLGGMGPLATVDFMQKVMALTPARSDQGHVPLVVSSIPQVPDRAAAYRGEGHSPVPAILESGRRLKRAGVDLVVMPCNTAHLWFDEIQAALASPMLHLVDAALRQALSHGVAASRLGLLSTDATLASGLFTNRDTARAGNGRLQWIVPTDQEMNAWVMPAIRAIKAGDLEAGRRLLARASQALRLRGAGAIILGCTEIPLVVDAALAGCPVVDPTAALAREVVAWSLGDGISARSGHAGTGIAFGKGVVQEAAGGGVRGLNASL
jgi:aspartate racemase